MNLTNIANQENIPINYAIFFQTYCELVPESQGFGNTKFLKIIRQESSTTDSQYYMKEEVLIIDSSEVTKYCLLQSLQSDINKLLFSLLICKQQPSKEHIVKIISYKNWPESSLPPPNELMKLWKVIEALPKNEKSPVVIVCR